MGVWEQCPPGGDNALESEGGASQAGRRGQGALQVEEWQVQRPWVGRREGIPGTQHREAGVARTLMEAGLEPGLLGSVCCLGSSRPQ